MGRSSIKSKTFDADSFTAAIRTLIKFAAPNTRDGRTILTGINIQPSREGGFWLQACNGFSFGRLHFKHKIECGPATISRTLAAAILRMEISNGKMAIGMTNEELVIYSGKYNCRDDNMSGEAYPSLDAFEPEKGHSPTKGRVSAFSRLEVDPMQCELIFEAAAKFAHKKYKMCTCYENGILFAIPPVYLGQFSAINNAVFGTRGTPIYA